MSVNVDPSVSLLISRIRNADPDSHSELMMYEMKKMAARSHKDDDNLKVEIWKKLYLQSRGMEVDPLDFVKASASHSLPLKRMGYQGLLESPDFARQLVLMPNTLSKDLETERCANEALIFISNIHDKAQVLIETAHKIKIPREGEHLYSKSLIAKSKYSDVLLFSMASSKEIHLLVKLQIALDKHLVSTIKTNDIEFLRSTIFGTKSPFTKLKVLQTLYKAFPSGRLILDGKLVEFLRNLAVLPPKRAKKQIEVGLAIEATKLLIVSGNLCERVEEFVFRLLNSENMNSRYLGLKIVSEYKIISEIAINRVMELGIWRKTYLDALIELIDESNYKTIYRRVGELAVGDISKKKEVLDCEKSASRVVRRLCDFGDQEFICRALYENPKLYSYARKKNLLIREQSRGLFNMILRQDNSDYFPMVYDLFPTKVKSHDKISSLCLRHLNVLINSQKDEDSRVFEHLVDFMCSNGDVALNRQMIRDVLGSIDPDSKARFCQKLISGILFFNIVLPTKLLHIRGEVFAEYAINRESAEISYPSFIKNVGVLGMDPISERREENKVIKTYEIGLRTEMVIVAVDQGRQHKKTVRIEQIP